WQETDLESLGLNVARCTEALQFVDATARIHSGERAVARLLIHAGSGWGLAGRFILVPGIRPVAGWIYRRVAANRHRLPGGTPACQMPGPGQAPLDGRTPVSGMEKSDDGG
ncbi:MAG: thiol-disulfide oxidoreductase DCC family protein, partial [Actinomycetota bacterium]